MMVDIQYKKRACSLNSRNRDFQHIFPNFPILDEYVNSNNLSVEDKSALIFLREKFLAFFLRKSSFNSSFIVIISWYKF